MKGYPLKNIFNIKAIIIVIAFLLVPIYSVSAQEEEEKFNAEMEKLWIDKNDFLEEIAGWEWLYTEKLEFKHLDYPEQIDFLFSPSHPQYRLTTRNNLAIYDDSGKLVRWGYIIRYNYEYVMPTIYSSTKEEQYYLTLLQNMYDWWDGAGIWMMSDVKWSLKKKMIIDDIKNNVLGIKNESPEVIETVLKKLGSRGKINDYDTDVATRIIKQLKSNHEKDLDSISQIKRIDDLTFVVTFYNQGIKTDEPVQIKFYQCKPYDYDYQIIIDGMIWYDSNRENYRAVDENIRNYYYGRPIK